MDRGGWGQDGLHRTRVTLGERVCGVIQCPAEGRVAGWRDLLHTSAGQSGDRKLATPVQYQAPAWVSGLQASGSGGVCARIRGLAGCAIPTGFAGQTPRSTQTNHALTFTSDHPMGGRSPRANRSALWLIAVELTQYFRRSAHQGRSLLEGSLSPSFEGKDAYGSAGAPCCSRV